MAIPDVDRLFVDTNVLVYAATRDTDFNHFPFFDVIDPIATRKTSTGGGSMAQ